MLGNGMCVVSNGSNDLVDTTRYNTEPVRLFSTLNTCHHKTTPQWILKSNSTALPDS